MTEWRQRGIIIGLLWLATALYLFNLAEKSLWGDEIFTAIFAAKPPAETIQFTAGDIHPPLYYLLVGGLARSGLWSSDAPGPVSDWFWRWLSVGAGLLTVATVYRFSRTAFNRRTALLAAALMATAPIALKYGQEARMHALFMLLSAFSSLALLTALKFRRRTAWVLFAVATTLNLYTMYFAFLVLAAQGVWLLTECRPWRSPGCVLKPPFQTFVIAVGAALLAYLPWLPTLVSLLSYRAQVGAIEGGVGDPLAFLPSVVTAIGPFGGVAWLFLGLYLIGLIAAARRNMPLAAFGGAWVIIPALLPLLLGDSRALHLRYAFILPIYLPFVALALLTLTRKLPRGTQRWALAFGAGVLLMANLWHVGQLYGQPKPNWRGAANFIAERAAPGDIILTGPLWDDTRFFSYYYPTPAQVMFPPTMAFQLPGLAADMAASNGKVWLVSRHQPKSDKDYTRHQLYGVWVMEPLRGEYDPVALVNHGAEFCKRAARQADEWAARMEADGVLNPDPRSSAATGYLCQGNVYAVTGDFERALPPHEKMVTVFPGWAGGYATLAKTYVEVDNRGSAVEAYQQAITLNPAWQGAAANSAAQLVAAGDLAGAIEAYQVIIEGKQE